MVSAIGPASECAAITTRLTPRIRSASITAAACRAGLAISRPPSLSLQP
jgi:hypothetical protein